MLVSAEVVELLRARRAEIIEALRSATAFRRAELLREYDRVRAALRCMVAA